MSYLFEEHMRAVNLLEQRPQRAARIAQCDERGLHVSIIRRERLREYHVTLEPLPDESPADSISRLHAFLATHQARIVRQEVFGAREIFPEILHVLAATFHKLEWPITWAGGASCEPTPLAGIHTFAVGESEVQPIYDGHAVGSVFTDGFGRHCLLGGIVPRDLHASPSSQAGQVFRQMQRYLAEAGLQFTDLTRTWLYLDQIGRWYREFNEVRRDTFEKSGVFDRCLPASTGIGLPNMANAALTAGAWALLSQDPRMRVQEVDSPLQCSARSYGSCFSRAVELSTPDLHRLFISGTASIGPDGQTEHLGDIESQIKLTMQVVGAILHMRRMDWENTNRATIYLKHAQDAWAWAQFELEHELRLPVIVTQADICRDDLLFEIELDAVSSTHLEET